MFRSSTYLLIITLFSSSVFAKTNTVIRHYQTSDRYIFGSEVLKLAMSKVGNYNIVGVNERYPNEDRGERDVISGRLDVQWMSTTKYRESRMIPIKIPVYRGILGLRLLLVNKKNKKLIESIKDINGLRKYLAVHGAKWKDLPIYGENRLKVETHIKYDQLFKILIAKRVDYFHRGLAEIWPEYERYKKYLAIADNVMLFYKHPIYFFVSKNNNGLAKDIEEGMKISLKDGSYKKLFLQHFGKIIRRSKLEDRTLIYLENSSIPKLTDKIDKSWWLPRE